MEKSEKKILSVDAGGAKGIYSILVMSGMQEKFGIDFNRGFDHYAGTSIGGVIAAALAYGIPPGDILAQFIALRGDLDKGHVYLLQKLFDWIDLLFGKEPFSKIKPGLFLPVYDFSAGELSFFSHESECADVAIADMLKSSCSDLRIVPPYRIEKLNRSFVDAGFFAYDPTLFFIRSCKSAGGSKLNLLSVGSGLIENITHDLNQGDKFDLIYDAFLYEQFQTTAFFFEESRQGDRYRYTRISEFPSGERPPYSLGRIVELAQNKVKTLQAEELKGFC